MPLLVAAITYFTCTFKPTILCKILEFLEIATGK